jgi:hypothetical protein
MGKGARADQHVKEGQGCLAGRLFEQVQDASIPFDRRSGSLLVLVGLRGRPDLLLRR